MISRIDFFDDVQAKERHLKVITEMLETGSKYKKVAYGAQLMIQLITNRLNQYEKRNDGAECINWVEKGDKFIKSLDLDSMQLSMSINKSIISIRFGELVSEQNKWDLSKVKPVLELM